MCQYFYQKGNIGVALKASRTKEFTLFRENFKKNNNTFPYINQNQALIGCVSKGNKIIGMVAYSYSENLETYRKAKSENYSKHSHIFDFEVLPKYRGVGIGDILLQGAFNDMLKHGDVGATINAINTKVALHYSKYGFEKTNNLYETIPMLKTF